MARAIPYILSVLALTSCLGGERSRRLCEPSSPVISPEGAVLIPVGSDGAATTDTVSLRRTNPVVHLELRHEGIALRVLYSADFPDFLPRHSGKGDVTAFFEADGTLLRVRLTNSESLSPLVSRRLGRWMTSLVNLPLTVQVPAVQAAGLKRGERQDALHVRKKLQYLRALFQVHFLTPAHRVVRLRLGAWGPSNRV